MTRNVTTPTAAYTAVRAALVEAAEQRATIARRYVGDPDTEHLASLTPEAWEQDCHAVPGVYELDDKEQSEIRDAYRTAYGAALRGE